MTTNNKVPWTELLSELRDRDKRWERLLCAKFNPLREEVRQMENQLIQICELGADNEDRITKLEITETARVNCNVDSQARAELRVKRWHVWAVVTGYVILGASAIIAAIL